MKKRVIPLKKKGNDLQVTIKTNLENPEPLELIAESIIAISKAFKEFKSSRVKQSVIVILLQDATGFSRSSIKKMLEVCEQLDELYLK